MKLTLASGEVFTGLPIGRPLESSEVVVAELVFCTGQSGYEEVLTDPSYYRQIVLMTFPLIGNTGINGQDAEHGRSFLSALVVRELEPEPSHYLCRQSLPAYLNEHGIPGVSGIDTRHVTRLLRTHGTVQAALSTDACSSTAVAAALAAAPPRDHVAQVSTSKPQHYVGTGPHVAVIDYGCKRGILRSLLARGCAVTIFPYDATAEQVLAAQPAGVVLSNGPGDPRDLPQALPVISTLQEQLPLLGICLGHQLFALANRAQTEKLHHGHRGCNRAVFEKDSGRCAIAAHNHGYAVTESSLSGTELRVTYRDLNDGCVEGLRHHRRPAFSVQFHPEAGPGPQDPGFLFDEFLAELKSPLLEEPCR